MEGTHPLDLYLVSTDPTAQSRDNKTAVDPTHTVFLMRVPRSPRLSTRSRIVVFLHNQNCTFTCETGYEPSGPVMCLAGNHFTSPTCDPLPCTADPDFIYHLNVSSSSCENTESNETCAFQCDEGFSPSGVATCYLGQWIEGPTCDENPCPGNPVVEHMDENLTNCVDIPSGGTCEISCDVGYTPTVYVFIYSLSPLSPSLSSLSPSFSVFNNRIKIPNSRVALEHQRSNTNARTPTLEHQHSNNNIRTPTLEHQHSNTGTETRNTC